MMDMIIFEVPIRKALLRIQQCACTLTEPKFYMKTSLLSRIVIVFFLLSGSLLYSQAPINDDCINAIPIPISGGGFDLGTFVSVPTDLTNATVEGIPPFCDPGEECFDSSIPGTLQSGSVWYSFSIPAARGCTLLVEEPTGIDNFSSAFAGFALYYGNTCFPGFDEIQQARLVPQGALGDSENPCLLPGDYLLQVVCNQAFNGPIQVTLTLTEPSPAPYDFQPNAGDLGNLSSCASSLSFDAGCLTIDDAAEYYPGLGLDSSEFTQSAWFTFTTPPAFDELAINVVPTAGYVYSSTETAFAYNLYQGDVTLADYASLPEVDDGEVYNLYSAYAFHPDFSYRCGELQPNTTYSLRLLFHYSIDEMLQVVVHAWGGIPTVAPSPDIIPAPNDLGVLSAGITNANDWFACNSRMELNDCGSLNPDTGIWQGGALFNLADWFTFELSSTSNVSINGSCWSPAYNGVYLRLFQGDPNGGCSTLNYPNDLVLEGSNSITRYCLPAGIYTLQVLGRSYDELSLYYWDACNYFSDGQLGRQLGISINVVPTVDVNDFSLSTPGAFDAINGMTDLPDGVSVASQIDVFGCENTLMPDTFICNDDYYSSLDSNFKAIYREFTIGDSDIDLVPDSGIITITSGSDYQYNYRLYRGSASSLSSAQGVSNAGEWISGLEPISECMSHYNNDYCCNGFDYQVCVTPGVYTLVTFGDSTDIALSDQVTLQFDQVTNLFDSPIEAENMGDIWQQTGSIGGTVYSTTDHFGCHDNAVALNGTAPCGTKAIYREFYLDQPSLVTITTNPLGCWWGCAYAPFTVFSGQVSQDISTLSPIWTCAASASTGPCAPLEAGWYTVVSYLDGPTYENTFSNSVGTTGNGIGMPNDIYIAVTPPGQLSQYNRPHKACSTLNTGDDAILTWGPNEGDNQWVSNENIYYLCSEYFGCSNDTPFVTHPIMPCNSALTKVAYYVFETTQYSYLAINTGYYTSQLFNFDVRTDSLLLPAATPIQPCVSGGPWNIQFCDLPPGTYSLVIWASDANYGQTVTPEILIDEVGYSRFDFAAQAYDFGEINPDNAWYDGKVGDVNPIDPSRAPSNDHFYCTTGAFASDPLEMSCLTALNDLVYVDSLYNNMFDAGPYAIQRNIWYTFTLDGAGTCNVFIEPKPGKNVQRYAIYQSDVNGSLPFSTVQLTGQVDSTIADGLTFVTGNLYSWWCYAYNEVSFYRDPCEPQVPTRYYVVVEHNGALDAINSQCELRIKWDPLVETPVNYDHFSQANCINGLNEVAPPYTNVPLQSGNYSGDMDVFVCASADPTDPINPYTYYCQPRTLWYYVDVAVTGYMQFRGQFFDLDDNPLGTGTEVNLFREVVAGDSSQVVLEAVSASGIWDANGYWSRSCVYEGRYYIVFPGCSYLLHKVYPEIVLSEQDGDFCDNPIITSINGIGSATASVVVDCHTIGQDFGESGNNMGCLIPSGANVNNYKSSWFRIDVTGSSSVDFTFELESSLTNVDPNFIRYRILLGSCDAMNVGSCFSSSQTINTINCLAPGSYYLQLVTPEHYPWGSPVTGSVGFSFTTSPPIDPDCMPQNTCFAITSFTHVDDCESDGTQFLSQSTAGELVDVLWQFGYNNQTSNEENPIFQYPLLDVEASYTVILKVTNLECGETAADTSLITIMPKPQFNIPDTLSVCDGAGVLLNANPSAATQLYWPQMGTTDSTMFWTASGWNQVTVEGTIGNCTRIDTAMVYLSPISNATLGPDRILCSEDSVYIDAYLGYGESYLWSDGDTLSPNYLMEGTYWVEWLYAGCVITDTIDVSYAESAAPLGPDTTVCFGSNGYQLDATTAGAYNYIWQDGSQGQIYLAGSEGLYWVDIYTPSCVIRDSVMITQFVLEPPVVVGDTVLCEGGSVTLSGPDNYEYLWSNSSMSQQIVITAPGTIWLQIEDSNNCTSFVNIDIIQMPSPIPIIEGPIAICENDTIELSTPGVFSSYSWSTGSTTAFTDVQSSGWISLLVEDDFGCTGLDSVEVLPATSGIVQFSGAMDFCEGSSTIISTVDVYNTYLWLDGSILSTFEADESGIVSVIVTDANGCEIQGDTLLTELAPPSVNIVSDTLLCAGDQIQMLAIHDPGVLLWSGIGVDGIASDTVVISQSGVYAVQVTNTAGCSSSASVTISDVVINPQISGTAGFCNGDSTLISGPDNYLYMWSDGSTTQQIIVDTPGQYMLTVTDNLGCTGTSSVQIDEWALPQVNIVGTDYFCESGFTTLESDQPFNAYSWSTGSDSSSAVLSTAGLVILTVFDGNNCSYSDSTLVNAITEPSPQFVGDFEFCEGDSVVIGLDMVFETYSWQDGSSGSQVVLTIPGPVEVSYTDSYGCAYALDSLVSMIQLPAMEFLTDSTVCIGGTETIVLNHSGNQVTWNVDPGAVILGDSVLINTPQLITASVMNSFGCEAFSSVEIIQEEVTAQIVGDTVFCEGSFVPLNVIPAFIDFIWSSGETASSIQVSEPGLIHVDVIDADGCEASASINIFEQPLPSVEISGDSTLCANMQVELQVLGEYETIVWSGGGNTNIVSIDTLGVVDVSVTDSLGCAGFDSIEVIAASPLFPQILGNEQVCPGDVIQLSSSEVFNSFQWSDGSDTQSLMVSAPGNFGLTVWDAEGCSGYDEVQVEFFQSPSPVIDGDLTFCEGGYVELELTESYPWVVWNNLILAEIITMNQGGNVTVEVSDINGCEGNDTVWVDMFSLPEPLILGNPNPCEGDTIYYTSNEQYDTLIWNGQFISEGILLDEDATLQLTVTDTNGCVADTSLTVIFHEVPEPALADSATFCDGASIFLDAGLNYFGYQWSGGEETQTIEVTEPGFYTVEVFDEFGCSASASTEVLILDSPQPEINGDESICEGESVLYTTQGGFVSYLWQDGSMTDIHVSDISGWVHVVVGAENGCTGSDSLFLTVHQNPQPVIGGSSPACDGEIAQLELDQTYEIMAWNTGDSTTSIGVSVPLTYSVYVENEYGCSGTAQFVQEFHTPEAAEIIALPGYCNGDTMMISCNDDFELYWWNGFQSDHTFEIAGEDLITLVAEDAYGCISSDSISLIIYPTPQPVIQGESIFCENDSTVLSVDGFTSYYWSNGISENAVAVAETGMYAVQVIDSFGCMGEDSLFVNMDSLPTPQFAPVQSICYEAFPEIVLEEDELILWENGDTTLFVPMTSSGLYNFSVSNSCGVLDFEVQIEVEDCEWHIYIPNSFTPDDDGLNDTWKPRTYRIASYDLRVFDRWGVEVFASKDMEEHWTGNVIGGEYYGMNDVYNYIITYVTLDGRPHEDRGMVVLLR
jgi:gliding motility-associated-like protein